MTHWTVVDKSNCVQYLGIMITNSGFAKVYSLMLESTVWDNPLPTRMCWIVLLMKANASGFVRCTPFSLARDAGVSKQEAADALETLSAPDEDSANEEHEGRRLLPAPGGWFIVSHKKYREYRTEKQIIAASKKRDYRSHSSDSDSSNPAASFDSALDMSKDTASASASASELKNKGSRTVPKSWSPNDRHCAIAKDLGVDLAHETERFRDHEFSRPRKDFDRAFSNWLRSDFTKRLPGTPPNVKPTYTYKPGMR